MNSPFLAPALDGAVRLTHWGVIAARGTDAVSFLQGQLTNDLTRMTPDETRLAGFCSAKGRLQASFLVWLGGPDEVLLACAADLLPATLKRLSMFVLRAKCKLSNATGEFPLWGRVGSAQGLAIGQKTGADALTQIRLADVAGHSRVLSLAAPAVDTPALPLAAWRWLEVESGVPLIEAATVDRFVPQMLNYEVLGGVDFKKGCYPGQEVVARSQYRGTIKRRMFLFDIDIDIDADADADADVAPGMDIFHSADPGQPAGMVVNAASRPGGASVSVLAEVKLAALPAGTLHVGGPAGPALVQRALPYAVPLDHADAV